MKTTAIAFLASSGRLNYFEMAVAARFTVRTLQALAAEQAGDASPFEA